MSAGRFTERKDHGQWNICLRREIGKGWLNVLDVLSPPNKNP